MKIQLQVLASSAINRKRIVIPSGALFNGFGAARGGLPSLLNHDYHRIIGWTTPIALVINRKLSSLIGQISFPTTDEESQSIENRVRASLFERSKVDEDIKSDFGNSLKCKSKIDCFLNIGTAIVASGSNILRHEFPELFQGVDEDCLIDVAPLTYEGAGIFSYKGFLIFPNPKFRRSFSIWNNLNEEFLVYYNSLKGNFRKRISLDDNIIGLKSSFTHAIELDYWWGPKFSQNIMEIEDGVARHAAHEDSGLKVISGIDFVDFRWSKNKENQKVFECEEVVNIPAYGVGGDVYGCKYMHSIFSDSNTCIHIDGAVRSYTDIELIERTESDLSKNGKNTLYEKLWRIDGKIDKNNFMTLAHYYFRSNTLVSEYFNDESSEKIEIHKAQDHVESNTDSKLIGEFNDLILSCGFIYKDIKNNSKRHISQYEILDDVYLVESCMLDIKKIFKRNNFEFTEEDCLYIYYADSINNLPVIFHCGEGSFSNAQKTTSSIIDYIKILSSKKEGGLFSFSIACEIKPASGEFIFFSFAGEIEKLVKYFASNGLPSEYSKIHEWCDRAESHTRKNAISCTSRKEYMQFLSRAGTVYFPRTFIDQLDECTECESSFAYILKSLRCGACGESYFDCCCISLETAKQCIVNDARFVSFFYTDRCVLIKGSALPHV